MKKFLVLFFTCLISSFADAQTEIKGTVTGSGDGKPLSNISVTIQDKSRTVIISYALSNDQGNYRISFKNATDSVEIQVTGLNIKKITRIVPNRSQSLDFRLEFQAIELKEVKIKPPKIRQAGDTINYLVDGYLDKNDRAIGDVLKKMPGIEMQENGAILYNNKPINKFYIENMDLLQGRYGIATKNISAKDVATVQVLENHQPIKALKERIFSGEAALNLKLKNSAKGMLIANGQAGTGLAPFLWNNELFAMYFTQKKQHISTYKGNNSGDDVSMELASFHSGDAYRMGDEGLLSVQSPLPPAISRKRYLFNRANAISVNNLWRLKNDYQLNFNCSYLNDRQEKDSYSRTTYYLPVDSLLNIEEKLGSKAKINQAEGEVQLNNNNSRYYLNNLLKFSGKWNTEEGGALSTTDSISQNLDKPSYKLSNTFQWVRNHRNLTFDLYSFNGYNRTSQTLGIQPVLYDDLFDPGHEWSMMKQKADQDHFSSVNRVSCQLQTGKWKQNYAFGFNADIRHLDSKLYPQTRDNISITSPDSLRNDLQWNQYEYFFSPSYTYQFRKLQASVDLPVSWFRLHINDRLPGQEKDHNRFFLNPSTGIRYELNAYWYMNAGASFKQSLGGINDGYTGYIMRTYRSLSHNDGDLPEQKKQTYRLSADFRHPLHAFFGNAGVSYFNTKSNLLYGNDYRGILSVRKSQAIPNRVEGYQGEIYLSKGIDVLASTLTLSGLYNNSRSSQISQNEIIRFRNSYYVLTPGISAKVGSWSSLHYRFTFSESFNEIRNNTGNFDPIRTTSQDIRLNIFPFQGLTINLAYEYFYNNAVAAGNRTMSFADAGAKYKWKDFEFSLSYSNILNSKQYISASYDNTSTYYYAYDLRPAEVLLKIRFNIKGK